ncbi:Sodium-dependent serotonin transporter [Toxocara canis]|uniref:Sodium-dependent serotonin transporter n=1 Tax=Toxocara canis TaxID=6265 RepID=A0A0B2VFT0_TOXCA|nr:Sodium-dependent serotonin transporter [Toxocara canis]
MDLAKIFASLIYYVSVENSDRTVEMTDYGAISVPASPCAHNTTVLQLNGRVLIEGATTKSKDGMPASPLPIAVKYSPVKQYSMPCIKSSTLIIAPLAETECDSVDHLSGSLKTPARVGDASPSSQTSRLAALRRRSSVVRDKWANKIEFLLAVIGYAVDLGNIWRFPSVCYKHGGGSLKTPARVGDASPSSQTSRLAALRRRSSVVRDKWANKIEFLLAVIGYAVDLGNIWRFPSVCYKHGGGAFLIPYLVMLLIGGLPMFYMELALGQFHRSGCISIWKKICPMFKGIGYGICFICTFIACFYNAIIAHAVYFVFSSLQAEVPWKSCNNSWNTELCTSSLNETLDKSGEKLRTPSEEYFLFNVLEINRSSGFEDLGGVKPSLAFCLLIVFLLVYFALWKGPRSSGKVVWVTATAPYIILTVLLVRGITLPGASKGIYYYLMPDFKKLLDPSVWTAAATQIFFSLGPGFGVLLALSSYNDFNNNCYRDALVTSVINCGTSFFAGFVIFSTLGYMAELTNRPVSEVVGDHDASLIFIVYPQAIATMSYSNCWSFIFFIMLITLGIDSTFSGIEALITGFCDEYPRILARKREIFVGFVIASYYFGSLPTVTYGGTYVIPYLDEYGVSLSVLFIVMCEMVAVCWFYGISRFSEDVRQMLGFYPGFYWRFCWMCCPIFIATIFLLSVYNTSISPMSIPSYTYPQWSVPLGWFLRFTSVLSVPLYAIYYLCNAKGTFTQRWKKAVRAQQRHASMASSAPSLGGDPQPSAHVMDSCAFAHAHTIAQL